MPAPPIQEVDDREPAGDASGVYEVQLKDADLLARTGSFDRVPLVCKSPAQIRALPLDPASAFLIGAMDGMMTIEMLFDLSPMPREAVVRALCLLLDHEVIALR